MLTKQYSVYVEPSGEYKYKIIILAIGLVSEIFCRYTLTVQLLSIGVPCLNDKPGHHLAVLSTLRSVTSGVYEMQILCISILSMKLRQATCVQVHVGQSSAGLCLYCKFPTQTSFKIRILTFFQQLTVKETLLVIGALQSYNTYA